MTAIETLIELENLEAIRQAVAALKKAAELNLMSLEEMAELIKVKAT